MLVSGDGESNHLKQASGLPFASTNGAWTSVTDVRNIFVLSLQLMTTDSAGVLGGPATNPSLAGAWKIEASNSVSFQPDQLRGGRDDEGQFFDITADFTPPLPDASTGTAENWPVTMTAIPYRHIRITFTPSNGNTFVAADKQRPAAFVIGKSTGN